jgi:lysophospholipase L1-like esterase
MLVLLLGLLPFYFIPVFLGTVRQAAIAVGVLVSALVLAEVIFQGRNLLGRRARSRDGGWPIHPFLQTCRRYDPARGINVWGLRGGAIEKQKPAGCFRVFFQGDSAFENEWTEYPQSLAGVFESRMKGSHPGGIEVQNAAVAWYSTQHALIDFLIRLQEFRPDLIILCHGMNDLYRGFSAGSVTLGDNAYRADYSHFWGDLAPIVQEYEKGPPLAIAQKLGRLARRYLYSDWRPQPWDGRFSEYFSGPSLVESEFHEFPSLEAFDRNLRNIVGIYRLKGTDVILATQPSLYKEGMSPAERRKIGIPQRYARKGNQIASIATMKRGMEAFNDVTRQVAKDLCCGLVDLEILVPKTVDYFANDVHFTVAANRLIGETLSEFVLAHHYLEGREKVGAHRR